MKLDHTFTSMRDYFSFISAKGFCYAGEPGKLFPPSRFEAATQKALAPLQRPLDWALQNINKPILVVALNVVGVAAATVLFYPDLSFRSLQAACAPLGIDLQPWMLKFGTYLGVETMITALMMRSFARLNRQDLLQAWERREIVPIHLGSIS